MTRLTKPKHTRDGSLIDNLRAHQNFTFSAQTHYPLAPSASLNRNFPPPPLTRFPGDGLDLRTPVMSNHQSRNQDVIDLTTDAETPNWHSYTQSRPPTEARRQPEVIDLVSDGSNDSTDAHEMDNSPEVEFVSSRPLSGRLRPTHPNIMASGSDMMRHFLNTITPSNDSNQPRAPPGLAMALFSRGDRHSTRTLFRDILQDDDGGDPLFQHANFRRPDLLRYDAVGFEWNPHAETVRAEPMAPPPPPQYSAPAPAPEGFTRTPNENDIVICPNCDSELGQGDDETKRQIWVIRSCGHVSLSYCDELQCFANNKKQAYCGQCAANRTKKKASRTSITKPFSRCVVEDCGQNKLTQKSMILLYM
jgi:hypothetical protein